MTAMLRREPDWETRAEDDETVDGGAGGDDIAEIRSAVETLTGATETRVGAVETGVTELRTRLEAAERALRRPGAGGGNDNGQRQVELERRAFVAFCRRGRENLSPEETRLIQTSVDTQGGVLAPDQYSAELQRNIVMFSPVRQVARVSTTSQPAVMQPKRLTGLTAQWVGEVGPRPETTATFGATRYEVCEIACWVDVSNQNLEDNAFDLDAELRFEFAEEFGRAEGAAFVNGDGNLKPVGFMQDPSIPYTAGGNASAITGDGLIDLYQGIKTPYRGNAVWGMNSNTLGALRKLKDANGQYLVGMAGINGAPATTILGRPVIEMPDMPDIGAGAFPVIFGDFMQGYRIFDRIALAVLRDPFTQATNGLTRFHGRRRVAGGVAKAEALRKLKIATS